VDVCASVDCAYFSITVANILKNQQTKNKERLNG
jgi:hypothetical protein